MNRFGVAGHSGSVFGTLIAKIFRTPAAPWPVFNPTQ